jgi:hypothetical protein
MADLKIDFGNIQQDAEDFQSAALQMVQTMEDAMAAIQTASGELSGSLASAANAIYTTMHTNNHAMATDLQTAANVLDQMAGILQNSDITAAAGFGS